MADEKELGQALEKLSELIEQEKRELDPALFLNIHKAIVDQGKELKQAIQKLQGGHGTEQLLVETKVQTKQLAQLAEALVTLLRSGAKMAKVKQSWWEKTLAVVITKPLESFKDFVAEQLELTRKKPKYAIGVRLVTKEGDKFYDAIAQAVGAGMGRSSTANLALESTLQDILTQVTAVNSNIDQLEGFTDGLESLITSLNGLVDGLEGFVDGIEALITTSNTNTTSIDTKLGEVQGSPTANTLLGRLKAIQDNTDNIEGFMDGIEALLGDLKTYTDQLEGYVDGLEGALTTLNAKDFATAANQTTIIGHIDAVESSLTTIQGFVDGIESALGTSGDAASSAGSIHAKLRQLADNTDGLEGFTDGVETLLTDLKGFVDGLEGFVDGIESQLTTITGHVDGLESSLGTSVDAASATGSVHAKLRQIADNTDGIETTLTTISSNVDQIEGYVDGIEGSFTTLLAKAILTATVSAALDSRVGLDIQHSSVATKNLVDFHSDDAAMRLTAGSTKILSSNGTRTAYYDLNGYVGIYFAFTDNSPGATGGTMYMRWSRDGTNTAYNDPGDGTGGTNYDGISTVSLVGASFIPKKARYVNFVFVQGAANQGSTYPQIAQMDITAYPNFFTSNVGVLGEVVVKGVGDAAAAASQPVAIGGPDSIGSPTTIYPIQVTSAGVASVGGTATAITGAYVVTAERGGATGTHTNVAEANASTQLAASATGRRGFAVHNDTANDLYLKFSTAASATSYRHKVAAGQHWEMPLPLYTGVVHGFSVGTGGNWRVTTW